MTVMHRFLLSNLLQVYCVVMKNEIDEERRYIPGTMLADELNNNPCLLPLHESNAEFGKEKNVWQKKLHFNFN